MKPDKNVSSKRIRAWKTRKTKKARKEMSDLIKTFFDTSGFDIAIQSALALPRPKTDEEKALEDIFPVYEKDINEIED